MASTINVQPVILCGGSGTSRLTNCGSIPLEIIEVQSGSYLGEDNIVRLKNSYGRN